MALKSLKALKHYIDIVPLKLSQFTEEELTYRAEVNKWSKKEILGHLLDSAVINLERFLRGQFEDNPVIEYDQDTSVDEGGYQIVPLDLLVDRWVLYNTFIVDNVKFMSSEVLETRKANNHTLAFLLEDYVSHLEHHLGQIFDDFDFKKKV